MGNRYSSWDKVPNTSYLGDIKAGASDKNVRYLGINADQAACEASCAGQPWCHAYTYGSPQAGTYASQCYGMSGVQNTVADPAFASGRRVSPGHTLMRRMGMNNAGKA